MECKFCKSKLKENGRDKAILFYYCPQCEAHFNYDGGLIVTEYPKKVKQ